MRNRMFILVWLTGILPLHAAVVLNEVVYINTHGLQDGEGDTPDWVELYNSGSETIALTGWGLSDNAEHPFKWTFPEISLAPGRFVVVFASGKNRSGIELHAGFKLGLMQEPVVLTNAQGVQVDRFEAQCVPANRSAARLPDGTSHWEVVQEPTPGSSNNASGIYPMHFNRDSIYPETAGGYFRQGFQLEIHQSAPGNPIYYTLDGSEPDEEATLYTGSIALDDRTREENRYCEEELNPNYQAPDAAVFKANAFRARAYSEGCPASNELNETYFIHPSIFERYGVPVVSLITDPDNFFSPEEGILVLGNHNNSVQSGSEWERSVHVEIFNPDGERVVKQLAGARVHGRGTRIAAQRSLRLYSGEKYGTSGFEYPFFKDRDLQSYDKLLLRSTRGDWPDALFTDLLSHHLVRPMNVNYMSGVVSVLFINGEYWGIQNICERQDSAYLSAHYPETTGSYDIVDYIPSQGAVAKEGSIDGYEALLDVMGNSGLSDEERYAQLADRIDLDNMIDFYIAQLYLSNVDFPELNQRLWKPADADGPWQWLFYDCDGCFYRYNYDHLSDYFNQEARYDRYADWSIYLLSEMLKFETFRNRFFQRFYWAIDQVFSPEQVLPVIDSLEAIYRPLMAEHMQRWRDPSDWVSWQNSVDKLRNFAVGRPLEVTEQLMKYYGNPVRVYPNPTAGNFTIEADLMLDTKAEFALYNGAGSLVFRQEFPEGAAAHSVQLPANISSGVYLIYVQTGYFITMDKLLVYHE